VEPGSGPTNVFQEERKNLWYALRNAGYRVDFVTENDVKEGLLAKYRVLYITGQNVERKAAMGIKSWVENGGIAFVTAGAARKDEFDLPFSGLDGTFGRGKQVSCKEYRGALRAKLELPFEKRIDSVVFGNESSPVLCCKETFAPAGDVDKVLARYASDSSPAWIEKKSGKGTVYCGGTLPGESYMQKGLPVLPMGKGGTAQNFCHFGAGNMEPVVFDECAKRLILLPLTENGIQPDIEANHRGVVFGRLKGPDALVIPVVNLAQNADGTLKNLQITVRNPGFTPTKVWSCFHKDGIATRQENDGLTITLPSLAAADVIIIGK
jgi:hypothetical protein